MTDINAVIAFYRARLDEDERMALAAKGHSLFDGTGIVTGRNESVALGSHVARHISRHDPACALKRVAAGRKLIHLHWQACEQIEMLAGHGIDATGSKVAAESYANAILVNAAVWDDHQDWDASWRPGWMDEIGYLPHPEESET